MENQKDFIMLRVLMIKMKFRPALYPCFIICLLPMAHKQDIQKPSTPDEPEVVVNTFCNSEYTASDEASKSIIYTPQYISNARKKYLDNSLSENDLLRDRSYEYDPVMVVYSYRIQNIEKKSNTAIADIEFQVAGKFVYDGNKQCADRFVPGTSGLLHQRVMMRYLVRQNAQDGRKSGWYIEDPSMPKVSPDSMLRVCDERLRRYKIISQQLEATGKPISSNILKGIDSLEKKLKILRQLVVKTP